VGGAVRAAADTDRAVVVGLTRGRTMAPPSTTSFRFFGTLSIQPPDLTEAVSQVCCVRPALPVSAGRSYATAAAVFVRSSTPAVRLRTQ
jgi:hypothetical protein